MYKLTFKKIKFIIITSILFGFLIIFIRQGKVEGNEERFEVIEDYKSKYKLNHNDGYEILDKAYKVNSKVFFESLNLDSKLETKYHEMLIRELKSISQDTSSQTIIYRIINKPIRGGNWIILTLGEFKEDENFDDSLTISSSLMVIINEKNSKVGVEGSDNFIELLEKVPEELISKEYKKLYLTLE